jgi:hypothetical protein
VDAFNENYEADGHTLELLEFPESTDEWRNQFVQREEAKSEECDIFGADVVWTAEFANKGYLYDLTPYVETRADEFIPSTFSTTEYNGKNWAVPFGTNVGFLYWRTDRVSEGPATWQEAYAAAQDAGGIAYQGSAYEGLTVDFLEIPSRATAEVATEFVGSLTLGSGQFCTNPGVVFVPRGEAGDEFCRAVADQVAAASGQTMLTAGICEAFGRGVETLRSVPGVSVLGEGAPGGSRTAPGPVVFSADAALLATEPALQDEIFGAAALVLRYDTVEDLPELLSHLDGQLTATIQADSEDHDAVRVLLPMLECKAGRVVYNGWPTGVEVNHSMVHGGPFPSTADGRTTSVGSLAIARFQRPVAYQNVPPELLPEVLIDGNPWRQVQFIDGRYHQPSP